MIKSFGCEIGDNFPIIKRDTNIFKDFGCEIGKRRLNLVWKNWIRGLYSLKKKMPNYG